MTTEERDALETTRRTNLRDKSLELLDLWTSVKDHWGYEDAIYRFYSQSFKVYSLQKTTIRIVELLQSVVPGRELNPWFSRIVQDGTGKQFTMADNARWLVATRPIVEAFQHARYFLEMACRYHEAQEEQPSPSGWAALLNLYQLW
ncbi:MAG: hypothetical protein ACK49R_03575 [Planctomycetota bacterium]